MTLYEKIMAIYPDIKQEDFLNTIFLQNDSDGKGDYIAQWNHLTFSEPTKSQLDAITG
jgi:hypothetical protein